MTGTLPSLAHPKHCVRLAILSQSACGSWSSRAHLSIVLMSVYVPRLQVPDIPVLSGTAQVG